jgi:hypothetical protein
VGGAPDSPAHPTVENGCYLEGSGTMEYEGKTLHLRFEHTTGDFWVAWLYVDQYVPKPKKKEDKAPVVRPTIGFRAQFEVGSEGVPVKFGGDFRDEGEDGLLVWYERVQEEESLSTEL